jgi:hypothetical protein
VCSSVLEALALGVPVVAAENGHRPPSVVTYPATDATLLCETVCDVLDNAAEYRDRLVSPAIRDTVDDEVALLIGTAALAAATMLRPEPQEVGA